MTLGVRRVNIKTAGGTIGTDHTVSPLSTDPFQMNNPLVGATDLTGDQRGTDQSGQTLKPKTEDGRPLWPSLFITDLGTGFDATNRSGDWQYGGTAVAPNAIYGSWKGAVVLIDKTHNPPQRTVTPDADPAKNGLNLGPSDITTPTGPATRVPVGAANLGYSTEVVWNLSTLTIAGNAFDPTHYYRVQLMVHDGDQNKGGGDVGQACVTIGPGYSTSFTKINPQS